MSKEDKEDGLSLSRLTKWVEAHPVVSSSLLSLGVTTWYVFRRGPYQAWKLGRVSKKWSAPVHSVRLADVQMVGKKLSTLAGEKFVVVHGPKGVGKTCIVDTVLEKRPGVMRFDIPPGKQYEDIMSQVFSAVSGNGKDLETSKSQARNILKWYNRFYRNYPAVVAFQAKERFPPQPAAHIGPCARDLGAIGFRVIVDASPHAMTARQTEREHYVDIEHMTKEQLFKIPEFGDLLTKLDENGLKEEVWQVLGGNPNRIENLIDAVESGTDFKLDVVEFLFAALKSAKGSIATEMQLHSGLGAFLKQFETHDSVDFFDSGFSIADDLKVLRPIQDFFVPNTPTIAFLLRLGVDIIDLHHESLSAKDKVGKLKAMVNEKRKKDKLF